MPRLHRSILEWKGVVMVGNASTDRQRQCQHGTGATRGFKDYENRFPDLHAPGFFLAIPSSRITMRNHRPFSRLSEGITMIRYSRLLAPLALALVSFAVPSAGQPKERLYTEGKHKQGE
jgi:hypothetical protein